MNPEPDRREPKAGTMRHFPCLLIVAILCLVVAMLITPADPISFLFATVFIFAIALLSYYFGLRAGGMSGDNTQSKPSDD